MKKPLFTVGIIAFKQYRYIYECIDSILMQEYPNIEIVICNDCSDDFDCESVKKYIEEKKSSNIKSVIVINNKEHLDTVKNANKVFSLAKGEFVKLHAADDLLYDEKSLSAFCEVFTRDNANIVVGRCKAYDKFGSYQRQYPSQEHFNKIISATPRELFNALAFTNIIHSPGVCLRRSFYEVLGGFDEKYSIIEDWPMWLKICRLGYKIHHTNHIVVRYRLGGISNSTDNTPQIKKFRQRCWSEYFDIYKNELLYFKRLLGFKTVIKLRLAIFVLKIFYDRDFEYDSFSISRKISFNIRRLLLAFYMSLRNSLIEWKNKITIKVIVREMAIGLGFILVTSIYGNWIGNVTLILGLIYILNSAFKCICFLLNIGKKILYILGDKI